MFFHDMSLAITSSRTRKGINTTVVSKPKMIFNVIVEILCSKVISATVWFKTDVLRSRHGIKNTIHTIYLIMQLEFFWLTNVFIHSERPNTDLAY